MGWHYHSQNLNEKAIPGTHREEITGPLWRHGRCWWTWWDKSGHNKGSGLHASWKIPCRHVGVSLMIGNDFEEDVALHVGVGLASLWLSVEGVFPRCWHGRKDKDGHYIGDIDTSLRFFDGGVWWNLWRDDSGWSRDVPRWRHGAWHPLDTFLGHLVYSSDTLSEQRIGIPLPEGVQPATVTFTRATWKRPRWPRALVITRANVTPDKPLPIPGKGENSWDMDDDAIWETTFPCDNVERAIGHVVEDVLRTRRRHGGSREWQPAEAWA